LPRANALLLSAQVLPAGVTEVVANGQNLCAMKLRSGARH
jgi:hypothetical protein